MNTQYNIKQQQFIKIYSLQMNNPVKKNSIKQIIKSQIQIHQKLLQYDNSDTDQMEDDENQLRTFNQQNLKNKKICQLLPSQQKNQHKKMNQKRKIVLQEFEIYHNQNQVQTCKNHTRLSKSILGPQSLKAEDLQIIDLKSKLAQLLKQSQQKSQSMVQLQTKIIQMSVQMQELRNRNDQNKHTLDQKKEIIESYILENKKIVSQYENRLQRCQHQSKINQREVCQIKKFLTEKQKHMHTLEGLVLLKDRKLDQMVRIEARANKHQIQNQKLKNILKRLLHLLQSNLKVETMAKSDRALIQTNLRQLKLIKSRSKSLGVQNAFQYSSLKSKPLRSQKAIANNHSLRAEKKIAENCSSRDLMKEVQLFLKKSYTGNKNKKFVSSLCHFICKYTQSCLNQSQIKMQHQLLSFKKEIQRKTNHSLSFSELMNERMLKIKSIPFQNLEKPRKFTKIQKTMSAKVKKANLQPENISILVPASNKFSSESRNKTLLSVIFPEQILTKDEMRYKNLQYSIKLHNKNSSQHFNHNIQTDQTIDDSILKIFHRQNKHIRKKNQDIIIDQI